MTKIDNEILQSIIYSPSLEEFHGDWDPQCRWVSRITLIQLKYMIKQNWIISKFGMYKASNSFAYFNGYTEGIAFTPDKNTELLIKLMR